MAEAPTGMRCGDEERWFAADSGVLRLLPEDRGWVATAITESRRHGLDVAANFGAVLDAALAALGPSACAVAAGQRCGLAALALVERGFRVSAVDLDPGGPATLGVVAGDQAAVQFAQAEVDALPIEAGHADIVVAPVSLDQLVDRTRFLIDARRVTRRDGALVCRATDVSVGSESGLGWTREPGSADSGYVVLRRR